MSRERGHKGSGALAMLYNGQQCVGHLIRRGKCGVEAFDLDDRSLGVFASQFEAIEALYAAKAAS